MDLAKENMDMASRYTQLDNKDPEIASTVTVTPGSTRGRWRSAEFGENFFFSSSNHSRRERTTIYVLITSLWVLSLAFTAWFSSVMRPLPKYSYETGFDTDLEPLRSMIGIKKVKFIGGLKFHENGTTYRYVEPGVTQYVGEPSEELDRAWRSLIRGQAIDLRGEEAEGVADKTYQKPGGWYLTGPDAFHQLHCLDVLRKALRPDYYELPNPEPVHTMHVEHCLDYLRQGVMCAADLTMIPVSWSEKRGRILQNTEVVHTCRDFDKDTRMDPRKGR
ncbi:hypothetical protein F5Y19DRAFT_474252 [Xylariaceae sp. FL1651]|nr:hypothetical protein F5Y19DRAFT_474252 [Xylariaceae sp. FL1651]